MPSLPSVRSSLTVSQMRAILLRLMQLRSDRSKLDVPILMTWEEDNCQNYSCYWTQHTCGLKHADHYPASWVSSLSSGHAGHAVTHVHLPIETKPVRFRSICVLASCPDQSRRCRRCRRLTWLASVSVVFWCSAISLR